MAGGEIAPRAAEPAGSGRQAGFDVLRAALTLLVVLHHTAITYGAIGGWFYRERLPDTSWSSQLLVFFCTVNQAFFMGAFFLLAGYFTPGPLAAKGPVAYARDRLRRLGWPLLLFGCGLGPLTLALAATARGRSFVDTLQSLWRSATLELGPLWFAWALLIFAALAWAVRAAAGRLTLAAEAPPPSDRTLLLAALATGGAAWSLRQAWPVGVNLWGLQLGYFASYVVLFAAGCLAAGPRWLERWPADQVRRWWRIACWTLPLLPAVHFLGRVWPLLQGPVFDAAYAFWEPFVAWGLILKLLQRSLRPTVRAPWRQRLARRAYALYFVHPPVLVAVALAWRDVPAPALLKFAVTGGVACVLCYVAAGLLLRLPLLRRVL